MFVFVILVIADGSLEKTSDDIGSEEDLYEDFRSSSHRYGHPGGGGEQLAINEVLQLLVTKANKTHLMLSAFSNNTFISSHGRT